MNESELKRNSQLTEYTVKVCAQITKCQARMLASDGMPLSRPSSRCAGQRPACMCLCLSLLS